MTVTINERYTRPLPSKYSVRPLVGAMGYRSTPEAQSAMDVLRKYGSDAHVYIPGVGNPYGVQTGNYQLSTGTDAVTDQPVGLSLDAAGSVGAELVVNGDFSGGTTGWTVGSGVTIANGVANISLGAGYLEQGVITTAGKTYLVNATVAGNATYCGAWDSAGQSGALSGSPGGRAAGAVSFTFTANDALSFIGFTATGAGALTIDNISVREVTGIHASQTTSGYRPVLRRGLVNLLTYSQGMSTVNWVGSNQSAAQDATAPDGTLTAHTLTSNNALSSFRPTADVTVTPLAVYTFAFVAKRGTATDFKISFYNFTAGSDILAATSVYSDIGTDWTTVVRTVTIPAGCNALRIFLSRDPGVTGTTFIYRAGLFTGTYTASQILAAGGIPLTTSSAASSSLGNWAWQFDGADDRLALGSVPFQMADDHCVVAGIMPNNTTSITGIFTISGTTCRVPQIYTASGQLTAEWVDDAGLSSGANTKTAYTSGAVGVVAVTKVGNAKKLRVNGAQVGSTSSVVMGATTATSGSIGSAGAYYHNGPIYAVIAIKGTVSDADLKTLEKWVGQLSGVTIA